MQKINNYLRAIASSIVVLVIFSANLLLASNAIADGITIDKVYHPYVQPLERELELRWLKYDDDKSNNNQAYRLGLGKSFAPNWFAEAYIIGEKNNVNNDSTVSAYELEAIWQLTEQGEYSADWGLLFEIERQTDESIWEGSTTLLIEREWGRTVGTANLTLGLEAGSDIDSELETAAAMQVRYRYSRALEPALELYVSSSTLGLGPVLMGENRFGNRKKLRWEFGVIAGLSDKTPNATLRALAEYEF